MPDANDKVRRFEFKDSRSNKYWEIWLSVCRCKVTTHWGRIGTPGAFQVKEFATPFLAERFIVSSVRSKVTKGYREMTQWQPPGQVQSINQALAKPTDNPPPPVKNHNSTIKNTE
jgi:predicted DNA-binding WGR domain protein